jgi:hypothetical protein
LFTRIGKVTDSLFIGEEKNTGGSGFFEQDFRMKRMNNDSMPRCQSLTLVPIPGSVDVA